MSSDLCILLTVNRRLDEWVRLEQLDLDSVENDVDEKVEDKVIYGVNYNVFLTYWSFAKVRKRLPA